MRPTFRNDLTCSREEQQGVVFYRIDDPKSQTSFRLYEIEFLIAKKLNGERLLTDVIHAVKEEYNFDISEPDLQKFVGQLDSMGFVTNGAAPGGDADGDIEVLDDVEEDQETTQIMRRSESREVALEIAEPSILAETKPIDDAELRRLLKSALLHVKQGYIVHARDYFLAAKELNPEDSRLAKLVSHLEIIGDASGPAEVEYLWNQARELFPDVADEVGPLVDASAGSGGGLSEAAERTSEAWDQDLRARVLWTVFLIILVVGGAGGLYFFAKEARIFEGPPKARVTTIKAMRLPIFWSSPASEVAASRETHLQVAQGGKVREIMAQKGQRVDEGQVLLQLDLPPPVQKQIKGAEAALKKATEEYEKAAKRLEKLVQEREKLEGEQRLADDKLKELKPRSVMSQGGVSKRDLEKWKKAKVVANKKLSALAKKERQPQAQEKKAKEKLTAAKKKFDILEQKSSQKRIRAPFAGVIEQVSAKVGDSVSPDQKLILLRDSLSVRLVFVGKDVGSFQGGGEALISVAGGTPSRAKIRSVTETNGNRRIEVTLVDPTGSFVDTPREHFKLVREHIDPAFQVPSSAVFEDERGAHVLVEIQERALLRDVEVIQKDLGKTFVRDRSGTLRDGEHLVTERVGAPTVAGIVDGSFLEIEK